MKHAKRILALLLAMVMCLGLATVALATNADAPTGTNAASITVNNAAKGETYTAYKLFSASVTGTTEGSIVYTGDIPTSLAAYFTKNAGGYIEVAKDVKESDLLDALKTWAKTATAAIDPVKATSNTVTLNVNEYGYYVVTSTTGTGASVIVTSTNPTATVNEKNTDNPTFPDEENSQFGKFVEVSEGVLGKSTTASVGDTLTYSISVDTSNYYDKNTQITKYIITDDLPAWLTGVTVTDVTFKEPNATTATSIKDETFVTGVSSFATNKKIEVEWTTTEDGVTTSRYANGTVLTVTYTAKLTADSSIYYGTPSGEETGNRNTATVYWNSEQNKIGESHATVNTYFFDLVKTTDETSEDSGTYTLLNGAEFELYKTYNTDTKTWSDPVYVTLSGNEYVVTAAPAEGATGNTTIAVNGQVAIKGLESGTYHLKETKAPAGYNMKVDDTEVTISNANLTAGAINNNTYVENTNGGVQVINNSGTNLPSTGGIGTTIFYVIGGILVVGAGVLLVTKKRMSRS